MHNPFLDRAAACGVSPESYIAARKAVSMYLREHADCEQVDEADVRAQHGLLRMPTVWAAVCEELGLGNRVETA